MGFVQGCEHDLFVSYDHRDNQPLSGFDKGWVTTFVENLKVLLPYRLGREECSVWIDHDLARHVRLTPEILGRLRRSATLLAILSRCSLQSDWCRQEREAFFQACQNRGRTNSNIFLVEIDKIDRADRPPEFSDLKGFRFWMVDSPGSDCTRPLGVPNPKVDETYWARLYELAHQLGNELKQQNEAAHRPLADLHSEDLRMPRQGGANVFLAEVTDDLEPLRESVETYLTHKGLSVLPEPRRYYPRPPDVFREAIDADLRRCTLFVQLLSERSGRRGPDLPGGYVGLQHERAVRAGIPILQWRSSVISPHAAVDLAHRQLLEGHTVFAGDIEEFKREVLRQAPPLLPAVPLSTSVASLLVFVNVLPDDAAVADALCKALNGRGHGFARSLASGKPAEIRRDLLSHLRASHGLIIIYGSAPVTWVRQQLLQWWKICPRQRPSRASAVYEGPPEPKEPINCEMPHLYVIDGRRGLNEAHLDRFLIALRGGEP
jgi:hypothetical protein